MQMQCASGMLPWLSHYASAGSCRVQCQHPCVSTSTALQATLCHAMMLC
jgi:hypothetical protein